jgi:stage II sporulation protein D
MHTRLQDLSHAANRWRSYAGLTHGPGNRLRSITLELMTRSTYHRLWALLTVSLTSAMGVISPSAQATSPQLVIRGAGFGHGVGMSQEGALGFAEHGYDFRFILAHYYNSTAIGHISQTQRVRVLLQGNAKLISLSGANSVNGQPLSVSTTYSVRLNGPHGVVLSAANTSIAAGKLTVSGPAALRLKGTAENGVHNGLYRGAMVLLPAVHGGVNAINEVGFEDYVRGVVSSEVPSSWPAAALEAQAVASRTYGLTAHAGNGQFDVYSDTRSQVYRGVAGETSHTDSAVGATAGQVVTYKGQPAITYFFASSGGETESVENAFPGASAEPWLRAVPDPFDQGPLHSWTLRMSFASASARLNGLLRGTFKGIEVLKRGFSPRIISAYVLGSAGNTATTGGELASRLGLYDTWAYFSVSSSQGEQVQPDLSGNSPLASTPSPTGPQGGAQASGGSASTGGAKAS